MQPVRHTSFYPGINFSEPLVKTLASRNGPAQRSAARMIRAVNSELMDALPHDHPDALRSRRDLVLINRLMGNWRWLAGLLDEHLQPGDRVLEIGAGRGEFLSWWNDHSRSAAAANITGLDLAPRPRHWPSAWKWIQNDIADHTSYDCFDIVLANLTLHHLQDHTLAELGRHLSRGPRAVLVSEPARRRLHAWQARVLVVAGINYVTRHDSVASVRAGFRDGELPRLLRLDATAWQVQVSSTWLGAYRMSAVRRAPAR